MNTKEFLTKVLPSQGWYCIVGMKQGFAPTTTWHKTIDSAVSQIEDLVVLDYNVYHACASYATDTRREQSNALYCRAHWLDLDCGSTKGYLTQEDAVDALVEFANSVALPAPTIISSGYGLLVYWVYDRDIPASEWKAVAEKLKQKCKELGLKADAAVTADEARILRPVGSKNFKRNTSTDVELWLDGVVSVFEDIKDLFGIDALLPTPPAHIPRGLSPLQKSLQENKRNRFSNILEKSNRSVGCNQLVHIVTDQANIDYNLWRAGLSIATNCVDGDQAVHIISDQHPNYSYDVTVKKTEDLVDKPYLCTTFDHLNPGVCNGCPHKGKIKSPIVLGAEIIEAEDDDGILHVEPSGATTYYKVPPVPPPFKRGKNGGIYIEKDEEIIPIYEHDLYLVKRMKDDVRGDLVLARLHLPREPVREFVIPLYVLSSKDDLRKTLSYNGVVALPGQVDLIMKYLVHCAKNQQTELDIEILRTQMGWADEDTKFIWGTQEISVDGAKYSPPSDITERIAKEMYSKGSLAEWRRVVEVYNRPGFEGHALAFLACVGAPLMKFTNYNGLVLNLVHPESGTGKTTILKMINSFVGHPEKLMSKASDTFAHKKFRLGVHCNIAQTVDEVTNMSNENVSDFILEVTQGEGSGRMQSQVNMERKNDTKWSTIAVTTSNTSLSQKVGALKATANGEVMRLVEYSIPRTHALNKQEAYDLYERTMYSNFGVAGPVYFEWLVNNKDAALQLAEEVQSALDSAANLTNQERYWSAGISRKLAGGIIARDLGLFDLDIDRIGKWVVHTLIPMLRRDLKQTSDTYSDVLGNFLQTQLGKTLIINNAVDSRTGMTELPFLEPKNDLNVRIEMDTKLLYISTKIFKKYCTEEQIIFKELFGILQTKGIYLGEVRKRMGKGAKMSAPAVFCYEFSFADDDIFGAEELLAKVAHETDEE
jgi:hypothetical protein